ncbi:urea ABC transporter permease subunit UrtB [Algirhabdus cladophorae]|uniref:urea ABC transporter permease subunit UrtB n=1 Tax=Algirhabdus cladophorae TaxID=3377108 RepID=UPI003B845F7C
MFRLILAALLGLLLATSASAQDLQSILQTHQAEVAKPGRKTVGVVLDDLAASGLPQAATFLERWQNKELYVRGSDGLFFYLSSDEATLIDITTEADAGPAPDDLKQVKPNGGVRRSIGTALVQFQLSDPDITRRQSAVEALARDMKPDQLEPLQASIDGETDATLKATKERLAVMMTASFAKDPDQRIAAIEAMAGDLSVDIRAVFNQILSTKRTAAPTLPEGENIAAILTPGVDIPKADAYEMLVKANLAQPQTSQDQIKAALTDNIVDGRVGGLSVAQLDSFEARAEAYAALAQSGVVAPLVSDADVERTLEANVFFDTFIEGNSDVTDAAQASLDSLQTKVAVNQTADLFLDGLSLASIYFLAAIGLAITFGVMGVINMAHGEFIMMGAYTGFVIQQFVPNYTVSIIIALPVAFAVTFAAGVVMERLVIRKLYHRPLETLLATFGISIALQQLAKNIFGTQARPLTSPAWLDGALVFNDVVAISYIRIAIFILALIFLGLILFILKRTRLGLEVRAVTQNPRMAASMGINPDRINMMTFGLGSGIAGIAGVAIGLYAKVTSEMGADYIVQSFMTVVVGGVGNVWGTLAGAGMIGGLQKIIEWFNPSNTLAAQTYMILFIILFIQFRPKGIVALKGRAAGD